MKKLYFTASFFAASWTLCAQTHIATNPLFTYPKANVTIPFAYYGEGISHPVHWGFDTAWENEQNLRKGLNHMGGTPVDLVRVSFRASGELINDKELTADMKRHINERCRLADFVGKNIPVAINSDQEAGIGDYYKGKPENWVKTIKAHAEAFAAKGHPIVTISPFNEPDYAGWNQGSIQDMKDICRLLKADSYFDGVRLSGGNTLNCDRASEWYNYMKEYLDEGNTHQLAGDFDHYADFFAEVRADGKHATADELHNIMEAFVGAEYGMQTGIWWASAERARGELMQAINNGVRIGYGESRDTWMAGAVYRKPDAPVKAFIGQSERQAATTTFAFRCDRPVFFDGQGPLREFYTSVTGGTGYQKGTTNGERVYDVHCGEDVPPVIEGTYVLVNRSVNHYCLETTNNNNGQQLRVSRYTGKDNQQWKMHQLTDYERLNNEEKSLRGGDYSYHSMVQVSSGKAPDVWNWSLDDGASICLYGSTLGGNQVYYLRYDSDGYFRLVNEESDMCLQPVKVGNGQLIIQKPYDNESELQQWRFIPVGVKPEFDAPAAPANLTVKAQSASLRLDWESVADEGLTGYTLLRSTKADSDYEIIARNLSGTAFVDHEVQPGVTYYYKVKATDNACNTSVDSNVESGLLAGDPCLVAYWGLNAEDSLYDGTENLNHVVTGVKSVFSTGKVGRSLFFNGTSQWAQMPYGIASWNGLTFAAWVKWSGGSYRQRIFSFANDNDHYISLTPNNGNDMELKIKNGEEEHVVRYGKLPSNKWIHVAVTIDASCATLWIDGVAVATSSTGSVSPLAIAPAFNYLGRGHNDSDPLFKGYLDEVRIYNHCLDAGELWAIASLADGIADVEAGNDEAPIYNLQGIRIDQPRPGQIYIKNGNKIINK